MKKYEIKTTDEHGNEHLYNVVRSSSDEPKKKKGRGKLYRVPN